MGSRVRRSFVFASLVALTLIGVGATGDRKADGTVNAITFSAVAPNPKSSALASLPIDKKEKLGWVVWHWNDGHRSDAGQTFRLPSDANITGISVLFGSSENLDQEHFNIEFEGFNDIEADVTPATEQLAIYSGCLPDDFDRQSPGKWVTFRFSKPMKLQRDKGYAFRLGFDKVRDYDLRRAFIRATNTDEAGQPRSAVPGRLTRQIGERHYAAWGSIEDMMFVLRTDVLP